MDSGISCPLTHPALASERLVLQKTYESSVSLELLDDVLVGVLDVLACKREHDVELDQRQQQ